MSKILTGVSNPQRLSMLVIITVLLSTCAAVPMVFPFNYTNPTAIPDEIEGTLIIANPETTQVITVVLTSTNTCPIATWTFQGNVIHNNSDYSISNPCGGIGITYTYTLSISRLTHAKSGRYSAVFTNQGGSTAIPTFLLTVPGEFL